MKYNRRVIARTNSRTRSTQIHNKKPSISAPAVLSKFKYSYVRKVGKRSIVHIVYPVYPLPLKAYGGVERGVYLLAKEQAKRGYDVYVFAHPESKIPGCEVIPCSSAGENMKGFQTSCVLKFIQNNKPDIIHDHSPWGLLGTSNCGCPVIRTIYGDPNKKYIKTVRKDAITTFTTKAFAKFYGFPDAPIIRAAVGENLNTIPFQVEGRGDWALFIGKMDAIKGPHTAITWARRLNKTLIIFGPISNRPFFNSYVRNQLDFTTNSIENAIDLAQKISAGKIVYGGLIARKTIWKAYLNAGVTFVPSQCEEAMSRVVQEAMLTGCPVIATDRGGIFESMGKGIGGRVVNSIEEVVEYTKTLPQWYDPRLAREHILSTRNPEVMADSCAKLYKKVLG